MNRWQMEGNSAPDRWSGAFSDSNGKVHYSIHAKGVRELVAKRLAREAAKLALHDNGRK